jgi:hypothetical protein
LLASVTFTDGLVATAWLISAPCEVVEVAAILVGGPTLPLSVELLQLATAAAANATSAA